MRIAIISDIHSNLEALTAVLEYCREHRVHRYVCLGDIVGYGADPNPCCELVRETAQTSLLGNHDAAVIGAMDESYYYKEAKDAITWTRDQLSPENLYWLYSLPYSAEFEELGFFHAAPIQPSGFYYVIHSQDAAHHMRLFQRLPRITFIGHSHLTQSFILTEKGVKDITGKCQVPKADEKVIITVGSVGQPRDRNPELCFVIIDNDTKRWEHVRLPYDISSAADKIEKAGLSKRFARRLYEGT